jgi:8-oxo-dGTP pyrophosphatase MutT (NUDIX family)
MFWQIHSEKTLYAAPRADVRIADVELPDGRHRDHHLIRTTPAAGAVVTDEQDRVLLIWRHRFITDSWGWEIPLGEVDEGEMPQAAAAREAEQKTGWRPGLLRPLLAVQPDNRFTDALHHVYRAESATHIGPRGEADRVSWIPLSGVRKLIDNGDIVCGTTLSSLLYVALDCRPPALTTETVNQTLRHGEQPVSLHDRP